MRQAELPRAPMPHSSDPAVHVACGLLRSDQHQVWQSNTRVEQVEGHDGSSAGPFACPRSASAWAHTRFLFAGGGGWVGPRGVPGPGRVLRLVSFSVHDTPHDPRRHGGHSGWNDRTTQRGWSRLLGGARRHEETCSCCKCWTSNGAALRCALGSRPSPSLAARGGRGGQPSATRHGAPSPLPPPARAAAGEAAKATAQRATTGTTHGKVDGTRLHCGRGALLLDAQGPGQLVCACARSVLSS